MTYQFYCCNIVSGIEALSRSIFVEHLEQTGQERTQAYKGVRFEKTIPLVKDVFRLKGLNADEFFDGDTWRNFQNAVEYRNLIVHECTFLRQDYCRKFTESCRLVLEAICARI